MLTQTTTLWIWFKLVSKADLLARGLFRAECTIYSPSPMESFFWIHYLQNKTDRWTAWLHTELELFVSQFPTVADREVWHAKYHAFFDHPEQYPEVSDQFRINFPKVGNYALRDALGIHCPTFYQGDQYTNHTVCGTLLEGFVAWHEIQEHENGGRRHGDVLWTMKMLWFTSQVTW